MPLALVASVVLWSVPTAAADLDLPSTAPASTTPAPPLQLPLEAAIRAAFARNRDVIAARLGVSGAEVERTAAGILPNPLLSYGVSNFAFGGTTLNCVSGPGPGNDLRNPVPTECAYEGFTTNLVHSVQLNWELEVWGRRGLRIEAANAGIEVAQAQLRDALRAIGYAVTSSWLTLQHSIEVLELAERTRKDYSETVRVSRERVKKGALAGNELAKIELEALKYEASVLAAAQDVALAQRGLKELLAVTPRAADFAVPAPAAMPALSLDGQKLADEALDRRPDLKAMALTGRQAERVLDLARRLPFPNPGLNVGYTRSGNVPAGDNANTLNVGLALPLPVFDRAQGEIGRARVGLAHAENDLERARITVVHDVSEAVTRVERTRHLLEAYEHRDTDAYGRSTNMLERADELLKAATQAYSIGATSLLDLLEAQRAHVSTRSDYLDATFAYRQALAALENALGGLGLYGDKEITP